MALVGLGVGVYSTVGVTGCVVLSVDVRGSCAVVVSSGESVDVGEPPVVVGFVVAIDVVVVVLILVVIVVVLVVVVGVAEVVVVTVVVVGAIAVEVVIVVGTVVVALDRQMTPLALPADAT